MRSLQLNLAKKLLIVDYETKEKLNEYWNSFKNKDTTTFHKDGNQVKAIFNSLQLTEKEYRSLIADEKGSVSIRKHPKAYLVSYSRHKNAFKDLIEKECFYWLENPLNKPTMEGYGWYSANSQEEESGWMYEKGEETYFQALKDFEFYESRTLKFPIIFEILEQ